MCGISERTKLTAEIFIKNLSLTNVKTEYLNELYDFFVELLLQVITEIEDSLDRVMIFGHNYALTNLCNALGNIEIDNVATSGFVQIEFEGTSWKSIKKG